MKAMKKWNVSLASAVLVLLLISISGCRNRPPVVKCAVVNPAILQGDTTRVNADVTDDSKVLTYSWSTTGGKISGDKDTATYDATGVDPGVYKITVAVSDKKNEVDCSTDIEVLKRNQPPTISCAPTSTAITQGESTKISATASDPNNDQLTYSWTVNETKLAATGPQVTFGSEGRQPGKYTVTAVVSDGEETASCTSTVTVQEKPNQPPVIECLTTTLDVESGGAVQLRARASDPDGGDVTISWSSTGGTVSGTGETATFNASGVRAGSYTVTATVVDNRQGRASCTMIVNVSERLSITQGEECGYFSHGGVRVDNCAKAILDDLAVRMTNQPELRANIIGYIDASPWETSRKALGERRAKAVASYLEEKRIAASRIIITDGGTNNPVGDNKTDAGRRLNRRVEIELSVR
jgi:outer membrane protein OmpA-like peptidoglycan-associated protein